MSRKPILYLDVDGVLIQFREDRTMLHYENHKRGFPAERVGDFLRWADANFEIRWLTSWASWGHMRPEVKVDLEAILWESVGEWVNPKSWGGTGEKTRAIDYEETRQWFWLDDETKHDRPLLPEKFRDRLIKTDSSIDPKALMRSALELYGRLLTSETPVEFPRFALDYENVVGACGLYD